MRGAIIGDIIGSRFEWNNIHTKDFELFTDKCFFTDDSVMTLAVAQAIMDSEGDYARLGENTVRCMQEIGRPYPHCGYGGRFMQWMYSDDPQPYNSYGNGAAMRVGACAFAAKTIEEVKMLARTVTEVTHNHPEGIKGAEATAVAAFLARTGKDKKYIEAVIDSEYYPMNFTLDGIRDSYYFNETSQMTVPQALKAFFESESFEDAMRCAISIGGDSDTLAAITGAVAQAYYGIPEDIAAQAEARLDDCLADILTAFEARFGR